MNPPTMTNVRALCAAHVIGIALAATLPAATAAGTSTDIPELYGSVIYADGWTTYNNDIGMYRIGTSDDVPFTKQGNYKVFADGGGTLIGDTYWACHFVDPYYADVCSYDTATWTELSFKYADAPESTDRCVIATGVVYDKTTATTYGCFRNDKADGYEFGTVDYTTLKRTTICNLTLPWSAIAVTRQGQLYAIDDNGILHTVDKTNGTMTRVGDTGLRASHPSSACIDPRSGRMFYAITREKATNDFEGALYEISLSDAKATKLYQFPRNEEIVGMYVPVPNVDDDAPDAISGLALNFPGGTLSGNVSFSLPSTTFLGDPGIGNLSYTVVANGTTVAEGTGKWGETVNAAVTLAEAGTYEFTVYATNPFGDGPKSKAEMFVGIDKPVTPNLTATLANGEVTLTWDAVTSSLHGGYIDLPNMTYCVTRYPDGNVLAEATTLTQLKDTPDADGPVTGYSYTVVANAGTTSSSDEARTTTFWLGVITPPYSATFDTYTNAGPYTVIDANNDNITWSWNIAEQAFVSQWNRQLDADDWLVTPPVKLEYGHTYTVTVSMRTYLGNAETVEIRGGNACTPAAMTDVLMPVSTIKHRDNKNYEMLVTPQADGTYYIGVHVVTPGDDGWRLYVSGISISAGTGSDIPDAVTDFTVTPDYNGAHQAEIAFKAPTHNLKGEPLTELLRIDLLRDGQRITPNPFTDPAPGKAYSYTDRNVAAGYHTYEIVAYNGTGKGKPASTETYIGVNEPARPEWVTLAETGIPGEVVMTWAPVHTDKDGREINPSLVTYKIITVGDNDEIIEIVTNHAAPTYTFRVPGADKEQKFVVYTLRAVTEGGESLRADTPIIPVGPAYPAPYVESFANGYAASIIRTENNEAVWGVYDDSAGIPSQDGDGGMAAMFGEENGTDAWLFSGKVSLAGLTDPVLTFYTYNITGTDPDNNELEVAVSDGTGFKPATKIVMSQLGTTDGWEPITIPLSAYAGKEVQFSFHGVTRTRKYTLIDNIRIGENRSGSLNSIAAPSAATVTTLPGTIVVTGAEGLTVKVFDTQGRTVANEQGSAETRIPVAPGFYIVALSDGTTAKLLVR